jgi:site-specific recombinase XerD
MTAVKTNSATLRATKRARVVVALPAPGSPIEVFPVLGPEDFLEQERMLKTSPSLQTALTSEAPKTLRQNPAAVYLARFLAKPKSHAAVLGAMKRILRVLGEVTISLEDVIAFNWASIAYQDVMAIKSSLMLRHGYKTTNHALSILRGIMRECYALDLIASDVFSKLMLVKGEKGNRLPKGRLVPQDEIKRLLTICGPSTIGIRDAAVLMSLFATGGRRAELCAVTLERLDRRTGKARVVGKGNKERVIRFGVAMPYIETWIKVRGTEPGPLFQSFDTIHKNKTPGLSESAMWAIVKRLAESASISPAPSPHDFRRTFISGLLSRGVDIATVQDMAGHASIITTKMYDLRGEEAGDEAHKKIKDPFTD